MIGHLRANLFLLAFTLVLCSVIYPLTLLGIGQTFFQHQAQGSLLQDEKGNLVGSRLIGQPFTSPEYFQPRPSASVDKPYNAAASGASNWGASHYLLRDRVARQLGPIAKFKSGAHQGELAGPQVEAWFKKQPSGFVAGWAKDHSGLAEQWVKDNTEAVARWLDQKEGEGKAETAKAAKAFFQSFSKQHPGNWPTVEEIPGPDKKTIKQIKPVTEGPDIQAYLFDAWLQSHHDADLEPVPADLVMASGSGLDPHITLKNAQYQLDRVADAWAKKINKGKATLQKEISDLLNDKAEAPLGGRGGVKQINVQEMNLALHARYDEAASSN